MTPKEKAIELYDKYFFPHYVWENDGYQVDEKLTYEVRKRFALIAVDEILEFMEADDFDSDTCYWANHSKMQYFEQVKQEIENL
jgi:hypothetical protein